MKGLNIILSLGLLFSLTSCAELNFRYNSMSLDTTERARVNERVEERYDQLVENETVPRNILLSDNAFPPGLVLRDQMLVVEKGYQHKILGNFILVRGHVDLTRLMEFPDLLNDVKRGIAAAGADYGQLIEGTVWTVKLDPQVAKKLRAQSID